MPISTSNTQKSKLTNSPNWNWNSYWKKRTTAFAACKWCWLLAMNAQKSAREIFILLLCWIAKMCGGCQACVRRGEDKTIFIFVCWAAQARVKEKLQRQVRTDWNNGRSVWIGRFQWLLWPVTFSQGMLQCCINVWMQTITKGETCVIFERCALVCGFLWMLCANRSGLYWTGVRMICARSFVCSFTIIFGPLAWYAL